MPEPSCASLRHGSGHQLDDLIVKMLIREAVSHMLLSPIQNNTPRCFFADGLLIVLSASFPKRKPKDNQVSRHATKLTDRGDPNGTVKMLQHVHGNDRVKRA